MLKYSLILIGIYVLYYGGNIVYDLFLKKEKTAVTDERILPRQFCQNRKPAGKSY
jgi:hypothetical protein